MFVRVQLPLRVQLLIYNYKIMIKLKPKISILVYLSILAGAFCSSAFHTENTIILIISIIIAAITGIYWAILEKQSKN